jgi:PleD family two-component response regulator
VVQREAGDADINALLSAADRALYQAKDAGRNIIGYRVGAKFGVAGKR